MLRVFILLIAVFFPIFSFAGPDDINREETGLPAAFTMDELTPEQRKNVEENYVTTGAFKVDLSSRDAEIKEQPLSSEELTDSASKLFKHGRTQEAIAKAQEAIDKDKDYLPAYRLMADMLQESGSADQSIPLYNMILQKNPNDAEIYMNRGYAYGRLNQLKPAIDDYNKAIELNPKAAYAISARATAYAKMGEMELAKRDYENLMNFNEEQACFGLGNIAAYYHRWDEALSYYDRTVAVSPNFAPVYLMKGQILLQTGKKQEAIDAIKKAKSLGMGIPPDLEEVIR
jgi:tetratricopeptide (TPR) repeat protein